MPSENIKLQLKLLLSLILKCKVALSSIQKICGWTSGRVPFFRKDRINDLFNRYFLDIFVKNYGEVISHIRLKFFPKFIRTAELTSPDLKIKTVLH